MWPFKRKAKVALIPSPAFTGVCGVRCFTADGHNVGRCWHSTYDGRCPSHGDVSVYLDDLASWPKDYEL